MTTRSDFVEYNRLKRKLEREIENAEFGPDLITLEELRLRCFPTKEEAIRQVEAFFNKESD